MLITSLLGFAQSREAGKYLASYLNMATGMPNNYADDIFKDSYGFVRIRMDKHSWRRTGAL